jgi:hypothetical protein
MRLVMLQMPGHKGHAPLTSRTGLALHVLTLYDDWRDAAAHLQRREPHKAGNRPPEQTWRQRVRSMRVRILLKQQPLLLLFSWPA